MSTPAIEQTILDQIRAIRTARESPTNEQQWISDHLTTPGLQALLPEISIVGLHLLSALQSAELTGIELATVLGVTRGGVTRAAKKLRQQGLISDFQRPDDRKKIFYRLTANGHEIARIHDQMHAAMNHQLTAQLRSHYTPAELAVITRFLTDLVTFEDHLH